MKQIQHVVTNLGLGLGACYGFFMIPSISELFTPTFLILIKQIMAILFAICLLISPKSLIEVGEGFAPKLIAVLNTLFGKNNKQ